MDIVGSAMFHLGNVIWFENNGSQSFITHIIADDARWAKSVIAVDMDGDGDMDVLSASHSDSQLKDDYDQYDKISWYENDGSQRFTSHIITSDINGAQTVDAADVDGDGDIDVLSTSNWDDTIAWYENDGSENFTKHIITSEARYSMAAYFVDLDGDSDLDVLACNVENEAIVWYENEGSQIFAFRSIAEGSRYVTSIRAEDLDGDGDLDVLCSFGNYGELYWYENDGSESFTAHLIADEEDYNYNDVHSGDVDGDGDMDVLFAFDGKIFWYENDGGESFTGHMITADGGHMNTGGDRTSIHGADIDGDGDMDVLTAEAGNIVAWYENGGSDNFISHKLGPTFGFAVSTMDIDHDSDMDFVVALNYDGEIVLYENDGSANFTEHIITSNADNVRAVYTEDLDGDGDIDVLSAGWPSLSSPYGHRVKWYENNGSEIFTPHIITAEGTFAKDWGVRTPTSVHATDLDNDGDMDVLTNSHLSHWGPSGFHMFINDGSENFTMFNITLDADSAYSVYAADLDNDGDMDVLTASMGDNSIAWYENDGSAIFSFHPIASEAGGASSVYPVDLDSDGDLDVLSAFRYDNKIAWHENDGSTNFTTHIITTSTDPGPFVQYKLAHINSAYATDMDNDGDMDVVSAFGSNDYADGLIAWHENDGTENFTIRKITVDTSWPQSIQAADLDGDEDMDLVVPGDYRIIWYENKMPAAPPTPFDLVYPLDDTTIYLSRDNSLDTLFFAWNPTGGRRTTYRRELTGDLPHYIKFIVPSDELSETNMYKIPYHHIEHYMHTAGVEVISGSWTIVAESGGYEVHAENGPFALTIDGSNLQLSSSSLVPERFAVHANYPNPFNPATRINYDLPIRGHVKVDIYDILGQHVASLIDQSKEAGYKMVIWDGNDAHGRPARTGVYFYQIQAGEFTQTRKMLLLK